MSRPVHFLGLLVTAFTLAGTSAAAQSPHPQIALGGYATVAGGAAVALVQAVPTETATGLPERPAQPRTMRDYWHVFIAFAVTWLLLFGYALTLGRRFSRLEEEVRRLRYVDDAE